MNRGRVTGEGRRRRMRPWGSGGWGAAAGLLLVVGMTALVIAGCGDSSETTTTAAGMTETTAAASMATTVEGEGGFGVSRDEAALAPTEADKVASAQGAATTIPGAGGLGVAEQSVDRKVIGNASILIEVTEGTFQTTFNQALQLADKYGGYVVSSNASASEGEDALRSGTVTVRIPSQSFTQALTDAGELGEVKSQTVDTQDVTEEYVDLEARLVNARAQEKALLSLMDKAKTVDEILQVQQYLAQIQMEIEQLKGRLRFLDEHTSYSTISISIYESGTEAPDDDGWGFVAALKDGLHAFVDGVNTIIVGLGGALPALILLVVFAYVVYRIVMNVLRRRQKDKETAWAVRQQAMMAPQASAQGYRYPSGYSVVGQPAVGYDPAATPPLVPTAAPSQPAGGSGGGPAAAGSADVVPGPKVGDETAPDADDEAKLKD